MKNNEIVYAEVDAILSIMDEKYINKIPKKLKVMFEEGKSDDYKPKINTRKSLNEQNLQRETLVILAMLCLNYWCENEEEKETLIKEYYENDKRREDELREKYDPDNIFKNRNKTIEEHNEYGNNKLIEYKESIYRKLWNKIKSLFCRR